MLSLIIFVMLSDVKSYNLMLNPISWFLAVLNILSLRNYFHASTIQTIFLIKTLSLHFCGVFLHFSVTYLVKIR